MENKNANMKHGVFVHGTVLSSTATLFDRKVNTGNITALSKVASQVASTHHCASLSEVASYEREIVNNLKYRADFTVDPTLSQPGSDSRRRR